MKKHATLLQVTVMAILAAAAVADTAASGGALGRVAGSLSPPFNVGALDKAYSFLSDVGGEEVGRVLDNISDALDPTKGDVGVPSNVRGVKEVTGAEYRSVLHYLDTECQGWDRQMGGMERALSADGVLGWVHSIGFLRYDVDWVTLRVLHLFGGAKELSRFVSHQWFPRSFTFSRWYRGVDCMQRLHAETKHHVVLRPLA